MCVARVAQAQQLADTLEDAVVRGKRVSKEVKARHEVGIKVRDIDRQTLESFRNQSLADLLAARSSAFVKSTGLNTFSTLSLRGASAAQTAVYWEGIPLMNGASGLVDLSLLPLAFTGRVQIDYGSSAALRGSGNVGGAVLLQDEPAVFTPSKEWRGNVGIGGGSFGSFNGNGSIAFSSRRSFMQAGLSYGSAANRFQAEDLLGNSFRMPHAQQRQWQGSAQWAFRMNEGNELSLHARLLRAHREIPPALFELQSGKEYEATDFRTLLQWRHRSTRDVSRKSYAKLALLGNGMNYEDSTIGLQSALHSRQFYGEVGWERSLLRKGSLLVFAPVQYFWLQEQPATQFRVALASSATMPFFPIAKRPGSYRFVTAVHFRLENFDGTWIGLPGLNLSYQIAEEWQLRGNVQYTYRAPTLNERYYQPGGNQDLRPEHGWSVDGGLDWQHRTANHWTLRYSLSAYDRYIRDWIIWLGGAIWTPHNLAAVRSRGLELEHTLKKEWGKTFWSLSLSGALVQSQLMESNLTGDSSIGKQLPYVPPLMAAAVMRLGREAFFLEWTTGYTGRRYTLSDESDWLPGYSLSGLNLVGYFPVRGYRLRVQLTCNNIFAARYEVVAYRPMPRTGWGLSAVIYLKKEG